MVPGMAGLVGGGVVGVGLATAAYVLAGLAIGGVRPVAAGMAVMLTRAGVGWYARRLGDWWGRRVGVGYRRGGGGWLGGGWGRGRLWVSTGLW